MAAVAIEALIKKGLKRGSVGFSILQTAVIVANEARINVRSNLRAFDRICFFQSAQKVGRFLRTNSSNSEPFKLRSWRRVQRGTCRISS